MSDEKWSDEAVDFVQAIVDTKLILGHRYAQWSLSGPSLEDNIGGASASQEEIGHVRQLASRLQAQGRDLEWIHGAREADEFANAACLDRIEGEWASYIAAIAPTDRAAWYLLDALNVADMEGMITKMGQDEYFHLEYHDARLETLAETHPSTLAEIFAMTLPQALSFIGPAAYDAESDPLYGESFTDRPIAEIRTAFVEHYRELFAGTDVSLNDVDFDRPSLNEWDKTRRRVGGGSISDTDLRQIRGTENELFIIN